MAEGSANRTRWRLKRVYEAWSDADGVRVLVDRLWPRGLRREQAHVDVHATAVAPSSGLRRWFGHEPARYVEFAARYRAELDASGAARSLADEFAATPVVTLLIAAKDVEHSQGRVLLEYLTELDRGP